MAIKKYNYELSIWDETLSENGQKTEKKRAIIGAHDMDYLGRATNIRLNRDIKGTNTLTFDMPQKYFDSKISQYVKNEFIDELYNEKKIKLNFNGQWFEFYIKSISEKKEFKSIIKSFTCQDSFIDELSRTGYEIIFDEELYNNVDEISPFMEVILEDSIWDYRPDLNTGDFTEFTEERFYKIPLKQFGGKISAYPIKLKVTPESLKEESAYYKKVKEKNKNFDLNSERNKEVILKNIYTNKERQLELGDDLSYRKEIFWDAHRADNGFALLDEKEKVTLMGDYIYVAYSDLSFIYGSIYEDPYKSTEEPALYGTYDQNLGYALQPSSKDPSSLIQFIFFHDNDEVFIDEGGTVANNDCHYVITIEEWNNILKSIYQKRGNNSTDKGLIYWKTEFVDGGKITEKYETMSTDSVIYTKNVIPINSTIDDFTWYPVYHEDYLSEINGQEVFAARKISITNRTEFNLKSEYYTTIYSNNAEEYLNLYSEKEKSNNQDELNFLKENDFRVQSKEETRIIAPTLARNLITNGTNITTTNGWERLTQNDQTEYNTGSYANLLEINVKTTTQDNHSYEVTGETIDEGISDYYLEILSPNIEKCDNFSAEGDTSKDYALNFGLTELENGIEKDKIYAIRICTGNWEIVDYNILFRKDFKMNEKEDSEEKTNKEELSNIRKQCTEEDAKKYKEALKTYNQALYNNRIVFQGKELTIDSDVNDFKKLIDSWVQAHDAEKKDFEKWSNVVIVDNDYKYLINRLYTELQKEQEKQKELDKKETKKEEDKKEENKEEEEEEISVDIPEMYSESLKEDSYESWISSCIFENKIFNKSYNQDLDKVIIGQGSIDINGNYEMDGVQNKESDKFITFSDIFERIETNINNSTLDFVGYEKNKVSAKETKSLLVNTLYHNKNNNKWSWTNKTADKGMNVTDNAFLLFKAKANISSPYVGILSESEPMTIKVEDLNIKSYAETDMSGVKIEARAKVTSENKETVNYLVDKVKYTIYILDDDNFSSDFLNRAGVLNDGENDNSDSTSTDKYDLKDGDLLANAEPLWTGVSSSTLPTFFRNITENPNGTGTNKYALFVNDLYYGILWLDKKGAKQKEGDK